MTNKLHSLFGADVLSSPHELTPGAHGAIRIPDLRNIPASKMLNSVIDHPAFQRLRRIRQLGPTHLVYPGAVHTRFEHSLGVYGCMIWFLKSLLQKSHLRIGLSQEDILTVLAAALLHDIGHYPFAHSLEALHLKGENTPKHEHLGSEIIMGRVAHLHGKKPLANILEKQWQVDIQRVLNLCTGNHINTPVDTFLRSLLSGAIDADKMDYLERDSHHMGVAYGRHYDRQRLLASLTINEACNKLAIDAKGKVSAEMFIFSRYTMFSEAYWHHTVRSASAMVEHALRSFYTKNKPDNTQLITTLLQLDDDQFMSWLCTQSTQNSTTYHLLEGMIDYRRALYKRVVTLSRVYVEEDKQRAYDIVYNMNASQLLNLTQRLRDLLSKHVGYKLHPADLIIDTPPRDKDRLEHIDVIYPDAGGQTHYPLHELSRVVAGVQDDFMIVVKKIRIFAHPTLAKKLQDHPNIREAILGEILNEKPNDKYKMGND